MGAFLLRKAECWSISGTPEDTVFYSLPAGFLNHVDALQASRQLYWLPEFLLLSSPTPDFLLLSSLFPRLLGASAVLW